MQIFDGTATLNKSEWCGVLITCITAVRAVVECQSVAVSVKSTREVVTAWTCHSADGDIAVKSEILTAETVAVFQWIAKEIPDTEDGRFILQGLKDHFTGECCEVGMYLAMGRQADREGYPEIAEAFRRYAFEEADHASRFAELLGEVVWADTKTNVEKRMLAEEGACAGKMEIAKKAKALNLDAIHDTVHEMAKDEARHGAGFQGLFNRFFKK